MSEMEIVSSVKCFGGFQNRYRHSAKTLNCDMQFSVFIPPEAKVSETPVLFWLSGLTCTDENFVIKAGAQRVAAELGLIIVTPDTSPRGDAVPDAEDSAYDLGLGAGFYVNATQAPWSTHYQMYDYIVKELPDVLRAGQLLGEKLSISGHSMGGHGAISIALKNSTMFKSVSAFAPIVDPMSCPWGQKALTAYLGGNREHWQPYDSCELMRTKGAEIKLPLLVDQGLSDDFYHSQKLTKPLQTVAEAMNYPGAFRYHDGYDHSYFFIASFIEEHLRFHAKYLNE